MKTTNKLGLRLLSDAAISDFPASLKEAVMDHAQA